MNKRSIQFVFALCALSGVLVLGAGRPSAAEKQKVRQPAVAGEFYPAQPAELGNMLDQLLAHAAVPDIKDRLVALISPHAAYPYSGGVAAHAYALLKGRKFSRVVVIAPSHFEGFPFAAVYDGLAYATPLGTIPVDKAFAARLADSSPRIQLSSRGHGPSKQRGEHALEVQLPFLQRALGEFQLVPIVMGSQDYETTRALGVSLAKLIRASDTLIVASSDLSHYHPYDDAVRMDRKVLSAIEEWDDLSLSRNFERRVWEACGGGPIVATMIAAQRLGASQAVLLKYANSGDVTGDRSSVVGYAAVALLQSPSRASDDRPISLGGREREELLNIAKKSVEVAVKETRFYQCPVPPFESLRQERAAFVTLKKKGQLRGCIGTMAAEKPLYLAVRDVAALAALRDPRFAPVTLEELGELEYEISVLSAFRRVLDVKQIQVGRHGLLILKGDYEGVLLPQVPVEQGWNRKTFLEELCRKAGLPSGAWQDADTDLFLFSALVFGENRTAPPVIPGKPAPPQPRELPTQSGQDSRPP
jgi:AmmeMemoRadiSam system protein B/AmmeMemoRadiSam system protein A